MKFAFIFLSLCSLNVFAAPIKVCDTVLTMPGEPDLPTLVEVSKKGAGFEAKITQTQNGQTRIIEEVATITEHQLRDNLDPSMIDDENMNQGEGLIVHAMFLEQDPAMGGAFTAGFDLKKAASVKVYKVSEEETIGMMAIVEAYDKKQKALGSFLGGFLISPCK